jgi:transposase-like protein
MPLTKGLLHVFLSHSCPRCGHKQEKMGRWFQSVRSSYSCPSCGQSVRMTYEDKVRLFETNVHRVVL